MINKRNIIYIVCFMFVQITFAQKHILYLGATAHLGDGLKIKNAAISTKGNKFSLVADANLIRIDPSLYDTIITINGKHIYPGFILTNTKLGITEIDQVKATHDYKETGGVNPNIRSLIAYNTDSRIINTVRANGVLITQVTPKGGAISGQSSIMYLNGDNWENAVVRITDGIHLNWPDSYHNPGWWGEPQDNKKNKKYNKQVAEIRSLFLKAKSYYKNANILDLKMESMKGVFSGEKNLYIHANYVKDIRKGLQMALDLDIPNIILVGGEDVLEITNLLKENNISVILNRVHRLPKNQDTPIDNPFTQSKKLQEEGILFCLGYNGDMEAMGGRNLPFTAGTAVAYGLDYEDAISSITLNAAKILGISDSTGSITPGKDATFFISSGDALDMKTNNVEKAFIKGEELDLNTHQKELFNKYK